MSGEGRSPARSSIPSDHLRRPRLVILAFGLVALLACLVGSVAWIVAGGTGALNSGVGAYIGTGGLAFMSGYLLFSLFRRLRAGAPLVGSSGPAARRWRRLQVAGLALLSVGAVADLGDPLWSGALESWRAGQGASCAGAAAFLAFSLLRPAGEGSDDAA